MAILNNPQTRVEIIQRLACGESQNSVSKLVGVSQQQICRIANKEDIKRCIEEEKARLIDIVPDAVQNVKDLVTGMRNIPDHEIKQRELAYKATKDVLKSVGIFPSPSFNLNVNNDNRQQTVIQPEVMAIIGRFLEESNKDTEER